MYQMWDEHGGYQFMLKNRREQENTGRPIPQVNEEYGYEDHYPGRWGEGRKWPARSADNRRRLAWEMAMAGCYQTTGERANEPGYGGWINGRGNAKMTMLKGYAHIRRFFERMEWWKLEPHPELVREGQALCLAQPPGQYVFYLPKGGSIFPAVDAPRYKARWFNPRSGDFARVLDIGSAFKNPIAIAPDKEDWVLLLEKRH